MMLAKTPTRGRLKMRSMKLPMYMLAITPQKRSGFSLISVGPGLIPWIRRTAMTTAMAGVNGMPSAIRGT